MANFTMLTSLLGSDREHGTYKTPLFYAFKSFSNNCRGNSIDTYVECDTFNTQKFNGIPYLDVTSVYSKESETVFINVVNRHKDDAIATDILTSTGQFKGKAMSTTITANSLETPFTYDKRDQYIPGSEEVSTKGNKITVSFPPHSFTQIRVGMDD